MILYDLKCKNEHLFEGWFRDSATFDAQVEAGELLCPVCGSKQISKAPMAPRIAKSSDKQRDDSVRTQAETARRALRELRSKVEQSCDYVGADFPEEARRIHYGESDARGIYGESSKEEARELREEGIEVQQIPWVPRGDS